MSRISILKKIITDRDYRTVMLAKAGFYNHLDDRSYLEKLYRAKMGRPLNLEDPKLFSEKLQWLKLYDRNPLYTRLVDKYLVREYVAEKLGEEYLIPLLGVWDDPDEIDFDALPDQFVLKCNHNSGTGMCICRDKAKLDYEQVRENLRKGLKEDFFLKAREWPYKDVPRKIVCEQYMSDDSDTIELTDYKFFCANGVVDNVMMCLERNAGYPQFYYFNRDWEALRIKKIVPKNRKISKPNNMDEMFRIAAELSKGFPFARIDLYDISEKIYFSEITFYPKGGWDSDLLPEADERLGMLIGERNL